MNYVHMVETCKNNIEDIKNVLRKLSETDDDFNGNNGELWDCAKGYDSNCEYLLATIPTDNVQEFIKYFCVAWLGNTSYYQNYDVKTLLINDSIVVSLVYYYE